MTTLEVKIPCPKCHKAFSVVLGDIAPGSIRPCPNCGAPVKFSGQDLGKVQQAVSQLQGSLGGASVKITVKTKTPRPWWKF